MPNRYGKGFMPVLVAAAKRQLSHGICTKFLFESQAHQTTIQKAIRQLCRKELANAADLYAKRYAGDATGVIVDEHSAKGYPAYEIEVIDAGGGFVTMDTVGKTWLLYLKKIKPYSSTQESDDAQTLRKA